eukprot:2334848-Rhodomonas_salina.1
MALLSCMPSAAGAARGRKERGRENELEERVNNAATLVVIDIGATEICISAAYEGTYNSNFPALTYEPQNGYIYTSFNEKIGGQDTHVFKVDLFADPPNWSDYCNSLSMESQHLSSTCLFNCQHCLFIDPKIATFNMHTGADLGVVSCGLMCGQCSIATDWFDSSPWRLAIFEWTNWEDSSVVVKDFTYADCLPDEYLWGAGRDVTCLQCPTGLHSVEGAEGETACLCDAGTVKAPDADPADEFPS